MDVYRPSAHIGVIGTRISMREVMKQVYLWMTVGLLLTAGIAAFFAVTGLTLALGPLLLVAVVAELGLVLWLAARITRMSAQRATRIFLAYAALNGVTLSAIFYWANMVDIWLALIATGSMFGAMTIIGYTTQVDLSRFRGLLFMALIGLIVASIVNLFLASSALYWLVTYAGVLIFTGLTAYDTQWIKQNAQQLEMQGISSEAAAVRQVAIIGALHLYLDFVNLFLYILRIVSDR